MKRLRNKLFAGTKTTRQTKTFRPQIEGLEARALMTASAFSPFMEAIELYPSNGEIATASSVNGSSIAVWSQPGGAGDFDVWAQRFGVDGTAIGGAFVVADDSDLSETNPAAAMDVNGGFVIAWETDYDQVQARRYDSNGTPIGQTIFIDGLHQEKEPSVAFDAEGNFVITYQEKKNDKWDVMAKRVANNGQSSGPVGISDDTAKNEHGAKVARSDDGSFAVVFEPGEGPIHMTTYNADGDEIFSGAVYDILPGERDYSRPDIAMDAAGNGVVVWLETPLNAETASVKAKRFSVSGGQVNFASTYVIEVGVTPGTQPSVALKRDGGSYLVTFVKEGDVRFKRMVKSTSGDAGLETGVLANDAQLPDVSVNGLDEYQVTYVRASDKTVMVQRNDFDFEIELNFIDTVGDVNGDGNDDTHSWTEAEKALVRQAADRWETIITGDLPNAMVAAGQISSDVELETGERVVDDMLIHVWWYNDPTTNALAEANWLQRREESLPFNGRALFNLANLAEFQADESKMLDVAVHEFGHALGFGPRLWEAADLGLKEEGENWFKGEKAVEMYQEVGGTHEFVPLEDDLPISIGSHWDESQLGNEIMSSAYDANSSLSKITVGALEDLGYIVDYDGADPYTLPPAPAGAAALTVTPSPNGNGKKNVDVVMVKHDDSDDGQTDNIEAVRNGNQFELWINGELVYSDAADNIDQLSIDGSTDDDFVTVDADLGVDVFFSGNSYGDAPGFDRFTIDGSLGTDTVNVWASEVDINGKTYAFDRMEALKINTRSGNSTTTIQEFPEVFSFNAKGGLMTDTYRINTTADPNGPVYLFGDADLGSGTLEAANRTNIWEISGSGSGTLNSLVFFSSMKNLKGGDSSDTYEFSNNGDIRGSIDGNGGNDALDYAASNAGVTVTLQSPTTLTADRVRGVVSNVEGVVGTNTTNDTITGPNASMHWYITGNDAGYVRNHAGYAPFTFNNVETLNGGSMNDEFRFYGNAKLSGDVIGHAGTDTLSYYGYFNSAHVDLMEKTATGVNGNVSHIENVTGSKHDDFIRGDDGANSLIGYSGNDILIGMGGNDYLRGSSYGRNILVGGKGVDTIYGGKNDDLMIAGYTDYEMMDAKTMFFAFDGMRDLWTRTDRTFEQRIQMLQSGFSSKGVDIKLDDNSVHDDGEKNTLTGGFGRDWFWASKYDKTDFNLYEDVLN